MIFAPQSIFKAHERAANANDVTVLKLNHPNSPPVDRYAIFAVQVFNEYALVIAVQSKMFPRGIDIA